MAQVALDSAYRRVPVDEFLRMDLGAPAELEEGEIRMMAVGSEAHSRIAGNILAWLHRRLRGSGCRPYNSDFATQTEERTVRFPDVSVYCNRPAAPENARKKLLGDPQVVFEVLSPSTSSYDQLTKLAEYRALPGVREIVFVDPDRARVRLVVRTAPESWTDDWLATGADVPLPSLALALLHDEIFADD